ncbi:MAG TPA: DUF2637 domain-containing protein [Streptosporangiaceae bacterium]|nr:DUF2637 domain-containing protein [Streptosporangiaceae bacterium]
MAASVVVVVGAGVVLRLAMTADPAQRARAREVAGSAAQYGLLFGFAAVAAAVSAHGLVGFARTNMDLSGSWPYLLWAALDGAAGLCAVLLVRRAARGESALAPRLAVWGLVTASSLFNWTHAPAHPGAPEAFALMPVIAAMLFEFSLRETRHTAQHAERRLPALAWLRPVERLRAQARLAVAQHLTAEEATHRVRVDQAAWHLYALRLALTACTNAGNLRAVTAYQARRAERRAQAALSRACFADPGVAVEVLRHVQVLTLTRTLAQLDYATPDGPQAAIASLITAGPATERVAGTASGASSLGLARRSTVAEVMHNGWRHPSSHSTASVSTAMPAHSNGHLVGAAPGLRSEMFTAGFPGPSRDGRTRDHVEQPLIEAATRAVDEARSRGDRLTQAALARQLRAQGFHIANDRLHWLATVSGLDPAREPRP